MTDQRVTDRIVRVDWVVAAVAPRDLLAESESWLTPVERSRLSRFARADAGRDFLIGRWLARRTLVERSGGSPANWRFELGTHGKPRPVSATTMDRPAPDLNLSHGGGVVICASAFAADVGADVESVHRRLPPRRRLGRFLAADEHAALVQLPADRVAERFWRLWTLKEAYLKAVGTGISGSLSSFHVELDAPEPTLAGPADSERWRLFELELEPPIHAAIAVRSAVPHELGLEVRLCASAH